MKVLSSFVSGRYLPVTVRRVRQELVNPFDESIAGQLHLANGADLEEAITGASKAYSVWSRVENLEHRSRVLSTIADELLKRRDEFALQECLSGKPFRESILDVDESAACFRYYSSLLLEERALFQPTPPGAESHRQGYRRVVAESLGVCGLVTSFNYPLLLASWKLAPALAAGNTAILKPSLTTCSSSLLLAEIASGISDLPSGTLQVMVGDDQLGALVSKNKRLAMVSFTGSTEVGRKVLAAAARSNLKRTTLELGGKAPLVVTKSGYERFNSVAVETAFEAAFSNMGQNCCAATKLYLESSIAKEFLDELTERMARVNPGDPKIASTTWGPIATASLFSNVLKFVERSKRSLNLRAGGRRIGKRGYFIEPTLFEDVPENSELATREVFGPVLAAMKPFQSLRECIERVNGSPYGLAAGIITSDPIESTLFTKGVQCGMVT